MAGYPGNRIEDKNSEKRFDLYLNSEDNEALVGDIVVCVHSEGIEHALTNGKRYTVEGIKSRETEYNGVSFFKYFLTIDNDNGLKIDYSIGRFKTLKEIREEKLNLLGI